MTMKITEVITTPPHTDEEQWETFYRTTLRVISKITGQDLDAIPQDAIDMISEIYNTTNYADIYDTADKVVEYMNSVK